MATNVDTAITGTERCVSCHAPLAGPYCSQGTIEQVDRYGLLRQQVAAKREQLASEAARERFHGRLAAFAEPVSFTNVVLLAATLHLLFRRKRRRFLEHAAFSMHAVSFVLLSSVTLFVAIGLRFWLGGYLYLTFGLLGLWQFAYLTVAIRRFYLARGQWGSWLLSVAAALLLYVLNTAFMTAVQVAWRRGRRAAAPGDAAEQGAARLVARWPLPLVQQLRRKDPVGSVGAAAHWRPQALPGCAEFVRRNTGPVLAGWALDRLHLQRIGS
jgi:hypothetical protein